MYSRYVPNAHGGHRGHQIPEIGMWVLGTEPPSPARAAHALNC